MKLPPVLTKGTSHLLIVVRYTLTQASCSNKSILALTVLSSIAIQWGLNLCYWEWRFYNISWRKNLLDRLHQNYLNKIITNKWTLSWVHMVVIAQDKRHQRKYGKYLGNLIKMQQSLYQLMENNHGIQHDSALEL